MAYLVIDDFKLGMDRRKERIAGTPGALWEGINGHINRGGSFERRKKMVKKYVLPAGTFSLGELNNYLHVWGSGTNPGTPAGIAYQQLAHPAGANMTGILDVCGFNGKVYAVAQYDDGSIYHYYDGSRVTSWDAVANANSSNAAIATALATKLSLDPRYIATAMSPEITLIAAIAGVPYTISAAAINGGAVNDQALTAATLQANVVAVPETRAAYTITVTGGTPTNNGDPDQNALYTLHDGAGRSLITGAIPWVVSNDYTAQAIANNINQQGGIDNDAGTPGYYDASAAANVVTVQAPVGDGTAANGRTLSTRTTGNFTWTSPGGPITNTGSGEVTAGSFSGGVNAIDAVAQVCTITVGGTYEGLDQFILTVDGVAYKTTGMAAGMGITCFPYQSRVWSCAGSLLQYCALSDPTTWGSGSTSGFINIASQDASNDPLVGIQQYQNRIAIFSNKNIQIWLLAVDPSQNTFEQSVQNTGALSNAAIAPYGNIDVFYLDNSGERSLRARDASNAPAVNDVGVSIDPFINAYKATLSGQQIGNARSVIEPLDGRYWLGMHNRIFAYSFFPGTKISAWTYYDLTDEIGDNDITAMVRAGTRVYLRSGDDIYLYGGDSGNVYPNDIEVPATLSLPFLSADRPDTIKEIQAFDVGISGVWLAELLPFPKDDTVTIQIGTFDSPTYSMQDNPIQIPTPLFALKLTCKTAGAATVSNMAIKYQDE